MNAIDFECPTCGAEPGERCRTVTGKMTPVSHPKRKQAILASPYLVADGSMQRCSVCGYTFEPDVKPSVSEAFEDHLRQAHKPGQTTEDVSQAAVLVVGESTEDK
jgi:rubredoxin